MEGRAMRSVALIALTCLLDATQGVAQTSNATPSRAQLRAEIARLRTALDECQRSKTSDVFKTKARSGSVKFKDGQVRTFVAFYGVRWQGGNEYEQLPHALLIRMFDDQREVLVPLKNIRRLLFRSAEKYRNDRTGGTVVFVETESNDGTRQSHDPAELVLINIQWTDQPVLERFYGTMLNGMVVTLNSEKP
ncbi:MAG: hypothetical protein M3547_08825 [Acidobacteriota bacterium]|nr:hypothetical protein [Acidobacteriota bacterium]